MLLYLLLLVAFADPIVPPRVERGLKFDEANVGVAVVGPLGGPHMDALAADVERAVRQQQVSLVVFAGDQVPASSARHWGVFGERWGSVLTKAPALLLPGGRERRGDPSLKSLPTFPIHVDVDTDQRHRLLFVNSQQDDSVDWGEQKYRVSKLVSGSYDQLLLIYGKARKTSVDREIMDMVLSEVEPPGFIAAITSGSENGVELPMGPSGLVKVTTAAGSWWEVRLGGQLALRLHTWTDGLFEPTDDWHWDKGTGWQREQ